MFSFRRLEHFGFGGVEGWVRHDEVDAKAAKPPEPSVDSNLAKRVEDELENIPLNIFK